MRIFDASKVFGVDKYILSKICHADFIAHVDNKHVIVEIKFESKFRNRIIPLLSESKNFVSNFSADASSKYDLMDSSTECTIEA